jgi:endonuclease-3
MTKRRKKEIAGRLINSLSDLYPYAKIQLSFRSPFELLVATILSAQCTDERVNIVTSKLFVNYNEPSDFIKLSNLELEQLIYSTGYYKAKARHIKEMSSKLVSDFKSVVPGTMDELLSLPGVGRKTANVILGHVFDIPAIVVDTHVTRIVNRLGLCKTTNAEKIEFELMELVKKDKWVIFTHYLINFGRSICSARSPKCLVCPLNQLCQDFQSKVSN